ncbi:hypothetical protein ACN4EG_20620 [Alkalinema pantanalense CENA528]|uniref:hypothetical protein n=1 Tax=Alkalinema pantanalense TaxID=1620705 RepID=UPI003D6FCC1D
MQHNPTLSATRSHDAFLNGYAPEDEGLYDDLLSEPIIAESASTESDSVAPPRNSSQDPSEASIDGLRLVK